MYKPEREKEILTFWKENRIFEKSLEQTRDGEPFVFYDGPPFATGLPHFGHVLPSTLKDIIPRYKTMQGRFVARKWGWDCHGLPVENLLEKELGLKTKKDILDYGIGKFNEAARDIVLRYTNEWKEIVPRLGRWVDMDNDYRTMDASYTEKVWGAFSTLQDKNLVYEGFKVMQVCPRCETSLSNFEVNQGYKDITDISVFVKFKILSSGEPQQYSFAGSGIQVGADSSDQERVIAAAGHTYFLAWTTTPWTLPGNVALAVGADIDYVKVKILDEKEEGKTEFLILAKNRLEHVLKAYKYEIVEEMKGSDLVGMSYEPIFDSYKDAELKNKERMWKVWAGEFVSDTDGTGIVHIAPGFGDDDLKLAQANNLPFIQHVAMSGIIKPEVKELAGLHAKPIDTKENKDAHQSTDVEVIKCLAHKGVLFAKEKIIHSYPHCWRCDTPLLNFATTSWFVRATDLREHLLSENAKVHWVPKEIGENRFGDWLKNVRDWGVSRSRFWGAPIPVWKSEDGKVVEFISSIDVLKSKIKKNNYFVMRHGEGEHNIKNVLSSSIDAPYHLTDKGKAEVVSSAAEFSNKKIDVIYASPLVRTKETAEIVKTTLGFSGEIIFDPRLREGEFGDLNEHSRAEYIAYIETHTDERGFAGVKLPNGEALTDIRNRVSEFLYEIDKKYEGKNVLIVTHEGIIKMMEAVADGGDADHINDRWTKERVTTGSSRTIDFAALPKNAGNVLDLHRPYIDDVVYYSTNEQGEKMLMKRVPDVFDCWFESGSMPFASKQAGYPAEFIAEGLDQTRGWFYSLLVLGVALFDQSPYNNVVVNGLILAEDGKKMSKSLKNYPEVMPTIEKYGADSLRYFLASSPSVKGEDTSFSEKSLDDIIKKHFNRLFSILSFYEMSIEDGEKQKASVESDHVLDVWIVARLRQLLNLVTNNLDLYHFDRALRPIGDFIDDLSVWYVRRSRDRYKGEDREDRWKALSTTRYILVEFSKIVAPFVPFLAEDLYQSLSTNVPSVHLEKWPTDDGSHQQADSLIIDQMAEVRRIVSLALEARSKAGIKVRQPLSRLMLRSDEKGIADNNELLALIADEVNVKEVILNSDIEGDADVTLDITLNQDLINEGVARELIRFIQDIRKKTGLSQKDSIVLSVQTNEEGQNIILTFKDEITKTARIADIMFEDLIDGETLTVEPLSFKLAIKKL